MAAASSLCLAASEKLFPPSYLIAMETPSSLSRSLKSSGVIFKSCLLRVADVLFKGLGGH